MKTLVIGGSGVISTAVTQQLIDRGDRVTVLNRGLTPIRFNGEVAFLRGDRADRRQFAETVRTAGPWDAVIDMICSDPADAQALADATTGATSQVVFCSTTNVYPKPADVYPVPETHRRGAAFKNGIDKTASEDVHRAAEARGAYAVTIIRPGHTYGEGGAVLNSLTKDTSYLDRIRCKRPLVVHGDGNGLWSALHVEDVARIFVAATGNPKACGNTYNATGEEWVTWNQYQAAAADAMGVAVPPLVHIPVEALGRLAPERAAQCLRSLQYPGIYDMVQARRDFGWRQTIPLRVGLRRTIEWLTTRDAIAAWTSDADYDRIIAAWEATTSRLAYS